MNWKIILLLSLFGAAMGITSLTGATEKIELYLWIAIAVICAFAIVAKVESKFFLHTLLIGIFSAFLNSIIGAIFFDTYLQNNPTVAAGLSQQPTFPSIRTFSFLVGMAIGVIYGSVMGGIVLLIRAIRTK